MKPPAGKKDPWGHWWVTRPRRKYVVAKRNAIWVCPDIADTPIYGKRDGT